MYARKRLRQSNDIALKKVLRLGELACVERIFRATRLVWAARGIRTYPLEHCILKTVSGLEMAIAFRDLEKRTYVS